MNRNALLIAIGLGILYLGLTIFAYIELHDLYGYPFWDSTAIHTPGVIGRYVLYTLGPGYVWCISEWLP
jgi:hypothetical protein